MANRTIVKFALREVILNDSPNLSMHTRTETLDELIDMERYEAVEAAPAASWLTHMNEFREHRHRGNRIETIKLIRTRLNCGLSEALILCKGIEAHDNHQG